MKNIKMKIITSCLSAGLIAGTVLTPISTYAAENASVHNIYETSKLKAIPVKIDVLGISNKISDAISKYNFNGQRAAFCKNLMETAFYAAGGKYNVVVFDLSQKHSYNISGIKMYSEYQFDGITFGVWIFDRNQPKGTFFRNDGRRGWDHWGCRGWQTQEDNVMWYNK